MSFLAYLGEGAPEDIGGAVCVVPHVSLKPGLGCRNCFGWQNMTVLQQVDRLHALQQKFGVVIGNEIKRMIKNRENGTGYHDPIFDFT